jgi:signal transduction histidine kinase
MRRLRTLSSDNPAQQRALDVLDPAIAAKLDRLEESVLRVRGGDREGAIAEFAAHNDYLLNDRIRGLLTNMHAEEAQLLEQRTDQLNAYRRLLLVTVLSSGMLLVLLGAGSLWVVRRYAGELQRSEEELRRVNEGLEETVRERTSDLTRANEEIQRFAYIVSHDLRAPLVNVMGFTSELEVSLGPLKELVARVETEQPQLLSSAAKTAVDADLPEAIGFIRSSTTKMDRLISAILRLSREGRRTLAPELIDMTAAIGQVAATVKHQADRRGAQIVVEGELPGVVADRLAIEQVFANVIENAVKYLKPGRPGRIVVRGRTTPTRLIYEVEDNGRGIAPKDHERIFDLFRRAGAQSEPGEGIGLAHVRATVYRLGGTISVESQLDRGATFRISLPRIGEQEQDRAA